MPSRNQHGARGRDRRPPNAEAPRGGTATAARRAAAPPAARPAPGGAGARPTPGGGIRAEPRARRGPSLHQPTHTCIPIDATSTVHLLIMVPISWSFRFGSFHCVPRTSSANLCPSRTSSGETTEPMASPHAMASLEPMGAPQHMGAPQSTQAPQSTEAPLAMASPQLMGSPQAMKRPRAARSLQAMGSMQAMGSPTPGSRPCAAAECWG